jgi:uncharacterized protein (DUF1800 family)
VEDVGRRDALKWAALAGAGVALAGCGTVARRVAGRKVPEGAAVPKRGGSEAHRFLNRLAFGPAPGDHQKFVALGREGYVREQLNPTEDDEPALTFQLSRLDVMRVNSAELRDLPEGEVMRQLRQGATLRAIYSRWQLRERMVDFWTNHFNIFAFKGDGAYRKGIDDLAVVRKNALGNFPDMVRASARSSAMLGYLDNQVNRKGVPNENYARELMELHTLGVHGGYTQQDVKEVARCFTGWTIETRFLRPRDQFRFDEDMHDDDPKVVLGQTIPAKGGIEDGNRVIDIVTKHPSCAAFLSEKLCRFFLGEAGTALESAVADAYLKSGGDVKAMLEPILFAETMVSGPPVLKRPFDFAVSAARSLNFETDAGNAFQGHLDAMGQPLFGWPMPDGYPDRTTAWTGSVLPRWNFAWAICHGEVGGTRLDLKPVEGQIRDFVLGTPGAGGETTVEAALALADPAFNWR